MKITKIFYNIVKFVIVYALCGGVFIQLLMYIVYGYDVNGRTIAYSIGVGLGIAMARSIIFIAKIVYRHIQRIQFEKMRGRIWD